jgi:hypothetical protein
VARGAAVLPVAMANMAGVGDGMGWTGDLCLLREVGAIFLLKSDVARGAPNQLLASRNQRGSTDYFIRLQNASTSFVDRRCEPNFAPAPILTIGSRGKYEAPVEMFLERMPIVQKKKKKRTDTLYLVP